MDNSFKSSLDNTMNEMSIGETHGFGSGIATDENFYN